MHNLEIWISHSAHSCFGTKFLSLPLYAYFFGVFSFFVLLVLVSVSCFLALYLCTLHTKSRGDYIFASLLIHTAFAPFLLTARSFVIRKLTSNANSPYADLLAFFGQHINYRLKIFRLVYCITHSRNIPHENGGNSTHWVWCSTQTIIDWQLLPMLHSIRNHSSTAVRCRSWTGNMSRV